MLDEADRESASPPHSERAAPQSPHLYDEPQAERDGTALTPVLTHLLEGEVRLLAARLSIQIPAEVYGSAVLTQRFISV